MATIAQLVGGLEILQEFNPGGIVSAEHDVIYAHGPDPDEDKISKKDKRKLKNLGWYWDEKFQCWAHFT
jgi:hypothetical protein